jgi:CDP-paratose 2-epimerase
MTALCQKATGNTIAIRNVSETRPADVPLYCTDNAKIKNTMGWEPRFSLDTIVEDTFRWMESHQRILKPILS